MDMRRTDGREMNRTDDREMEYDLWSGDAIWSDIDPKNGDEDLDMEIYQ